MKYSQVNILIGSACDMQCPYCLQTSGRSPANKKADPEEFAEKLAAYLDGASPEKIMIWGGEPMLYWKTIRIMHSRLSELGIRAADGQCIVTTNGRSIPDDYVEYANANSDIWTTVSCHGGGFSDAQLDTIHRLKRFSLSELITHQRTDLWEIRDWFWKLKDRYGGVPRLCVHFLRATDSCGSECYMTKDDVDAFCRHIEQEVIPMARYGDPWALWQCSQLIYEIDRYRKQPRGAMCVRPDRLSIDMHGNVYECHHDFSAANVVGNVFSKRKTIPIRPEGKAPGRFWNSKECQACPEEILSFCKGGCYLSNTHDIDCYLSHRRYDLYKRMKEIFR